ncbi:5'-3' exonuclease [Bacillus taeanensis]|uniref:5'-3' exonuclease n=1 Tax=Bacillus taeanensis TaxID=273032 RepID=A0A366XQC1_9BACI|nr:5'-3' exonuclease [Bacillus taeanensis]RBW67718.1 flap endonuclease [Bacillus taeanensis]
MNKEKLLLIDGFNLLSRCYFATAYGRSEEQLQSHNGFYTNAIRVMLQKLQNLWNTYQPTHFAIAWDVKREETIRKQRYQEYKATRGELPFPLIQQFETLQTLFNQLSIPQLTIPQYEADDIIGALSMKWKAERNEPCYIYSNDRDLLQLLDENTSQIISVKKQGDVLYTLADFKNDYQITPAQWIDVKALLGDKSDNIPGVTGVGEKAALPLVQMYGSIENIYNHLDSLDPVFKRYTKKLLAGRESAVFSKELVTIYLDIPALDELTWDLLRFSIDKEVLKKAVEPFDIRLK